MKYISVLPFTLLLLFYLPVNAQDSSKRISISGHIVNEEEEPIPFATVSIGQSGKGVVSDSEGFFFLKLMPSDTLALSTVAHQTQYLYFGDTTTTDNYDLRIKLGQKAYELQSVTVFAFKDEYAFKRAILEMDDLPEEKNKVFIPGSYTGPRREPSVGVGSPVSLLAGVFNKRARYEREAKKKIAASRRNNTLAQKYNRELVGQVTGLESDKLDKFMTYCRMKDLFRDRPNDYEIVMAINQCYADYKLDSDM